MNKQMIIVSIV